MVCLGPEMLRKASTATKTGDKHDSFDKGVRQALCALHSPHRHWASRDPTQPATVVPLAVVRGDCIQHGPRPGQSSDVAAPGSKELEVLHRAVMPFLRSTVPLRPDSQTMHRLTDRTRNQQPTCCLPDGAWVHPR
jgi:hypothetical protein